MSSLETCLEFLDMLGKLFPPTRRTLESIVKGNSDVEKQVGSGIARACLTWRYPGVDITGQLPESPTEGGTCITRLLLKLQEKKMTKTVFAKFASVAVAFAMVMTVFATPVAAQSNEELQDQIQDLLATIAALQAQISGATAGSGSSVAACNFNFTRDLSVGSQGADVQDLQEFLNWNLSSPIAVSGPGSPGNETTFFGPVTRAGVVRFQEMHRASVLSPLGLTAGTGYFGASSRAQARAVCADLPEGDDDDDDDMDDDMDEGDDDDDELSGGEASLEDYDVLNSPSNEDVEEGQEEVEVFGFEFDVEDGDVEIRRIDVFVQADNQSNEDEPWRLIEEVQLWHDGDMIASEDADSESDWEDGDENGDGTEDYRMRFTGLSEIFREGDTAEFIVSITVRDNVDSGDVPQDFLIGVEDRGIRGLDGANLDQFTGDDSDTQTFTIEEAGENAEIRVSLSSDSPDSGTIAVEENDDTDDVEILVFDIEGEDAELLINEARLYFEIGTADFNDVVEDITLEIDGVEYDDWTAATGNATNTTVTFDLENDGPEEFELGEDEEVEARVIVDFNQQSGNYANGETIFVAVRGADIDAWDVEVAQTGDDLAAADLRGSVNASGNDTHILLTEGIFVDADASDHSATERENDDSTQADNEGVYTIVFEVTAFEEDAFIERSTERTTVGSTTATEGAMYEIEDSNGDPVTTGTTSASLTSSADQEGNFFRVNEGTTETFTLRVNFDPATTGNFFQAQLQAVGFNDTAAAPDDSQQATPEEDFESPSVNI